jgi:hypothetical protein
MSSLIPSFAFFSIRITFAPDDAAFHAAIIPAAPPPITIIECEAAGRLEVIISLLIDEQHWMKI